MLRFTILGCKRVRVDTPLVLLGRILEPPNRHKVVYIIFGVFWAELQDNFYEKLKYTQTTRKKYSAVNANYTKYMAFIVKSDWKTEKHIESYMPK